MDKLLKYLAKLEELKKSGKNDLEKEKLYITKINYYNDLVGGVKGVGSDDASRDTNNSWRKIGTTLRNFLGKKQPEPKSQFSKIKEELENITKQINTLTKEQERELKPNLCSMCEACYRDKPSVPRPTDNNVTREPTYQKISRKNSISRDQLTINPVQQHIISNNDTYDSPKYNIPDSQTRMVLQGIDNKSTDTDTTEDVSYMNISKVPAYQKTPIGKKSTDQDYQNIQETKWKELVDSHYQNVPDREPPTHYHNHKIKNKPI
jgi:gas vesicle protein